MDSNKNICITIPLTWSMRYSSIHRKLNQPNLESFSFFFFLFNLWNLESFSSPQQHISNSTSTPMTWVLTDGHRSSHLFETKGSVEIYKYK